MTSLSSQNAWGEIHFTVNPILELYQLRLSFVKGPSGKATGPQPRYPGLTISVSDENTKGGEEVRVGGREE